VDIDSTNPPASVFLAGALREVGRIAEGREILERLGRAVPMWRRIRIDAEDSVSAMETIARYERRVGQSPTANTRLAFANLGLRDSTRFFEALERATAAGEIWPTWSSLSDPRFDFVRGSARFAAIVRSVGLDERIFTSPTGGRVK
jgi:hypothetical protein